MAHFLKKMPRELAVGRGHGQPHAGIFQKQREAFQRPRQLAGGVIAFGIDLRRCLDQLAHTRAPQVAGKKAVRIVEITHDLLETREVLAQPGVEFRLRIEEARHGRVFDRTGRVGQAAAFGQRDDVLVAEDFEPHVREGFAQELDGRQREQEIADGAAADDQNLGN